VKLNYNNSVFILKIKPTRSANYSNLFFG